jgi:GT2 family glycosyltransferase
VSADVSVVVVSWNVRGPILECLASVCAEVAGLSAEVFVVDNGSEDGSAAAVRESFPGVRVIETGANVGFALAANVGLREATGRALLLLNPDARLLPGALGSLLGALRALPDAGICVPLLRHPDGSPQPSWARFPGVRAEWTGRLDRSQAPAPPTALAGAAPFPVDWVGGACLLARREAVEAVGLLDERFFLYGEDVEWCHRMLRGGWRTYLVPAAAAVHHGGMSAAQVSPAETRRRLYAARLRLYRALYGPVGALAPSAVAAARYAAGRLLRRGRA